MKSLISCKPCVWNVTEKYLKSSSDQVKLNQLRKIPIVGSGQSEKKFVVVGNNPPLEFTLGKNGEYFRGQISLLGFLQVQANLGHSKVKICS